MLIIIIIMYKCAAFLLGLQQESFWIHSEQLRSLEEVGNESSVLTQENCLINDDSKVCRRVPIVLYCDPQVAATASAVLLLCFVQNIVTKVWFSCSWNVKEIHQAADYLKVEEVVTKCKIKMEDFAFIANPSSTETSSITGNVEMNQQTCLLTLRDYNDREKADIPPAELVQPQAKKSALEKKSAQTKKRKKNFSSPKSVQNKSIQYQNDVTENTSIEMFLDANKLAAQITEQAAQGGDSSELQLAAVVESETLAAQDILVQTIAAKQKRGKPQQSCALKEHCMSNIASEKNAYQLESSGEELDQKYSKAKPVCNTCGKVFSEASSLRRHMRIHKGVKPYVCQLCGKAFTQCNQLKTHVRTHTGKPLALFSWTVELCNSSMWMQH